MASDICSVYRNRLLGYFPSLVTCWLLYVKLRKATMEQLYQTSEDNSTSLTTHFLFLSNPKCDGRNVAGIPILFEWHFTLQFYYWLSLNALFKCRFTFKVKVRSYHSSLTVKSDLSCVQNSQSSCIKTISISTHLLNALKAPGGLSVNVTILKETAPLLLLWL